MLNFMKLLLNELIDHYPGQLQYRMQLASIYAEQGDLVNARETAEKIIEIDPSTQPTVETFLNSLEAE